MSATDSVLSPKPLLMAPAGSWATLEAALRFGADGVYLACDRFGMRARAQNFSLEDMPAVVRRVHEAGAEVSITLNTLMDNEDMEALPRYLEALAEAGVDGLIIGDAGAFALARRLVPQIPLTVSTQASVMNAEAANLWHELGAKRVVCAREMSLASIAKLREATPSDLSLEAFVHGAMCVAYSGRCLLSAAMTGRSGNKGACAQSCRWSYGLVEEMRPGEVFPIEEDLKGTFIMNSQDLCMIDYLDQLAAAGIDTFKIEGRNKQAFYVATVVGAYRRVMDGGSVEEATRELSTISHRPYGTGFYFGEARQTPEQDGYIKEWVHAATVEDCEALPEGSFRITVLCHNRFESGDILEVVSPTGPSAPIRIGVIHWHSPIDGGIPFVERPGLDLSAVRNQSLLQEVPVANRSKEHYAFTIERPLNPGDFLRRQVPNDSAF